MPKHKMIPPQKFSFKKSVITNGCGKIISHGITVTIDIDAFKADKSTIKKDFTAIFAEVLEYLDWFKESEFYKYHSINREIDYMHYYYYNTNHQQSKSF